MKHSEFLSLCEDTWCVCDLIEFAYDNDIYDVIDDIVSEDSRDDMINEEIKDYRYGWKDLLEVLENVETGNDYYYTDYGSAFYYRAVDNSDFNDIKERIEEYMDGLWGDEDDADEDNIEIVGTSGDSFPDDAVHYDCSCGNEDVYPQGPEYEADDFDVCKLFDTCSGVLQTICVSQQCKKSEETEEFRRNISMIDTELLF